jgi:hypothetical protein
VQAKEEEEDQQEEKQAELQAKEEGQGTVFGTGGTVRP